MSPSSQKSTLEFSRAANPNIADHRPISVRLTHPVPEDEAPERGTPAMITIVEAIARSFFTGEAKITLVSWRILLDDEWESIRACARRAGCTAQAISRRVGILARDFGIRPNTRNMRCLDRWVASERFKTIRREDRNPPAASDDPSKTITHGIQKGGRQ